MDTEAIASEIVYLKNLLATMDRDPTADPEERARLRSRKRDLQGRLAEEDHREEHPPSPADEVQFIPPA